MSLTIDPTEKFFLEDESDGSMILVSEIEINPNMVKSNYLALKGTRFYVDYEEETIDKATGEVEVVISFSINGIYEEEI